MSRNRRKEITRHLSEDELDRRLAETNDPDIVCRLIFIKNLYAGDTLEDAANRVGKSASTGSRWARRWNEGGLERLTPDSGGGRPPKLGVEERKALVERLENRQPWEPNEIKQLLSEEFGVEYHPAYLSEFLRNLGLSYSISRAEQSFPVDVHDASADERLPEQNGDTTRD